jgi:hypothetical protein
MSFINRHHIIRRALLIAFTYFFFRVTYAIFCQGAALDAYKVSAYGIFAGMETLLIRFYLNSRDKEEEINRH